MLQAESSQALRELMADSEVASLLHLPSDGRAIAWAKEEDADRLRLLLEKRRVRFRCEETGF